MVLNSVVDSRGSEILLTVTILLCEVEEVRKVDGVMTG